MKDDTGIRLPMINIKNCTTLEAIYFSDQTNEIIQHPKIPLRKPINHISTDEVSRAINKIKTSKASGPEMFGKFSN